MDYSKLLQAILDIAEEMLVCGAEVRRVEDSIEKSYKEISAGQENPYGHRYAG